ncbi:hypothetical protein J4459_02905 [Candidatus Woesearchaeota archaeon]|nr:hypothetical protein [Candidatus Woesearchaeota archaeon]
MDFEENLRISFEKIREEMTSLKEVIKAQNEVIRLISLEISKLRAHETLLPSTPSQELLHTTKSSSSTGNNGAPHSRTHALTHSLTHNVPKNPLKPTNEEKNPSFSPHTLTYSPHTYNENNISLYAYKSKLNQVFGLLPKTELRVFLTIYQMEDENYDEITYFELAKRIKMSEAGLRSYISSLIKKEVPLERLKSLDGKSIILRINRDFKTLNLKQKIINLYYESDPNQKTLFESPS